MSLAAIGSGSMSSGEFHIADPDRALDIERKHERITALLADNNIGGLLLTKPANFAWFTTGGDSARGSWSEVASALFITPEARVVLAPNTDSGQVFDRQIPGLGFQLKERIWQEPREVLLSDLCRGRAVASDAPFERCTDGSFMLGGLRLPLSKYEIRQLREAGQLVAHAVEATARTLSRGEQESEIAGQVAHRMLRHQIYPERIQVCADGHSQQYRHWAFGPDPVRRYCTITAIGRKNGLHVGTSRTVSFGSPPKQVRDDHLAALLVQATGMFFSQDQWEIFETWKRVERIYEKFGNSEEWHFADQGMITGYQLCEQPIAPKSEFRITSGMPIFWQPSIRTAQVSDTIVVKDSGFEVLTPMENWPQVEVDIKGVAIPRPDILLRPE